MLTPKSKFVDIINKTYLNVCPLKETSLTATLVDRAHNLLQDTTKHQTSTLIFLKPTQLFQDKLTIKHQLSAIKASQLDLMLFLNKPLPMKLKEGRNKEKLTEAPISNGLQNLLTMLLFQVQMTILA